MAEDVTPAPEVPEGATPPPEPADEPEIISYDRFKQVVSRAKAAEAELEKAKKEQAKAQEAALKEQERWKELYEQAQPKAEAAERYEATLSEILDGRLEAIPEDKRGLVPDGDALAKLAWLEKATAAGLFAAPPQSPGNPPPGSRRQQNIFDLARMSAEDIRKARKEGKIGYDTN